VLWVKKVNRDRRLQLFNRGDFFCSKFQVRSEFSEKRSFLLQMLHILTRAFWPEENFREFSNIQKCTVHNCSLPSATMPLPIFHPTIRIWILVFGTCDASTFQRPIMMTDQRHWLGSRGTKLDLCWVILPQLPRTAIVAELGVESEISRYHKIIAAELCTTFWQLVPTYFLAATN